MADLQCSFSVNVCHFPVSPSHTEGKLLYVSPTLVTDAANVERGKSLTSSKEMHKLFLVSERKGEYSVNDELFFRFQHVW